MVLNFYSVFHYLTGGFFGLSGPPGPFGSTVGGLSLGLSGLVQNGSVNGGKESGMVTVSGRVAGFSGAMVALYLMLILATVGRLKVDLALRGAVGVNAGAVAK